VIKVSKTGYAEIASSEQRAAMDLKALVAEHDTWMNKKGRKKKVRKSNC